MASTILRAALGMITGCLVGAVPVLAQSPGTPAQALQSGSASDAMSGSPSAGNPRGNAAGTEGPSASGSTTTMPSGSGQGTTAIQGTPSQAEQSAGSNSPSSAIPSAKP